MGIQFTRVAETYLLNQLTFCVKMVQVHKFLKRLLATEDLSVKIVVASSITFEF